MPRFLAAPAVCLALCGAAAAQDMPALATLNAPDPLQPVSVPAAPAQAAGDSAGSGGPDAGPAKLGSLALRGVEAATARTADLKSPSGAARPWCAQERRVGTGAGFCLVN